MDPITRQNRQRFANVAAIVLTFGLFMAAVAILAVQ